jgi:hypothetical protein
MALYTQSHSSPANQIRRRFLVAVPGSTFSSRARCRRWRSRRSIRIEFSTAEAHLSIVSLIQLGRSSFPNQKYLTYKMFVFKELLIQRKNLKKHPTAVKFFPL